MFLNKNEVEDIVKVIAKLLVIGEICECESGFMIGDHFKIKERFFLYTGDCYFLYVQGELVESPQKILKKLYNEVKSEYLNQLRFKHNLNLFRGLKNDKKVKKGAK
jgi:hypothetical protein